MANSESERTTTLKGNPFRLAGPELKAGDTAPDFEAVDSTLHKIQLKDTGSGVRIFSVVPSLDTPVCDAQTKRFEEESGKLADIRIFTISMDLPFAQKRWCGNFGINRVVMLSDHLTGSFGEQYGTLIPDLRIESRAIFVVDSDNTLRHVEYVKDVGHHPDYEAALTSAKAASERSTHSVA
jgi:thioredoxin-dependent peroxiredoxin